METNIDISHNDKFDENVQINQIDQINKIDQYFCFLCFKTDDTTNCLVQRKNLRITLNSIFIIVSIFLL